MMLQMSRIREGRWEGVVLAERMPQIEVMHLERVVGQASAEEMGKGRWRVSVALPATLISDGTLTFVVMDRQSGETLGAFAIVAGQPLGEDLRAEIDLLRAELDLLKRAFRRHCVETGAAL